MSRLISREEEPEWLFDLQKALVEPGVCDFRGGNRPHPQDVTDIMVRFLIDRGIVQ